NRLTTLGAFANRSAGSQVSSSKPTQQARYSRVRPRKRESTISSTSHSGSSSTMIGGGAGCTCPGSGSVAAGSSRETWKTGWTFIEGGRSSLYAWEEIFCKILNFPKRLKSSFVDGRVVLTLR